MSETTAKNGWSRAQLIEFYRCSIRRFGESSGFVHIFIGDECSCGLHTNTPHGAGWFCECGRYNVLPYSFHRRCFTRPDIGPPRHIIWEATRFVVNEKPRHARAEVSL